MIFTTDKETLFNKLRIVEKTTVKRGIQPVLSNILFEACDNVINLTATDLDVTVKTSMPAAVTEQGKITLPAAKLVEIVSKLPDRPIEFKLNSDNGIMNIKCGKSTFDVIGISADEFPNVVEDPEEDFMEIDMKSFVKAIKNTVYATAKFEMKNIISGVFCLLENGKLEMAATDGSRLSRYSENIGIADKSIKAVVPASTLNEIIRIDSVLNEEKISIASSGHRVFFKTKGFSISSNVLNGEYPAYGQLIPKSAPNGATINKEDLRTAIERVSCMVNERTETIRLFFTNGLLTLKSDTPDAGSSEETVPAEYTGDDFLIAFNYKFLNDFLKITEAESIHIDLTGNLSAAIFKPVSDEDTLCLIMPVQL